MFTIYPRKVEGGVAQLSSGLSALDWLVQMEFVRKLHMGNSVCVLLLEAGFCDLSPK